MVRFCFVIFSCFLYAGTIGQNNMKKTVVWTQEQAQVWYAGQPWLVGCNYIPSTAINQLEMWQVETFDTTTIKRELGLAASIGMNSVRVYLHDLAYKQNPKLFLRNVETFLRIASIYNIKTLFVFFDSCWNPYPKEGKQHAPIKFKHNSGWVQSPGLKVLEDTMEYRRLEKYITDVVQTFRLDDRVLAWDIWNEPDFSNEVSYPGLEPKNKISLVLPLLEKSFFWVRNCKPTQPLTSGLWNGSWGKFENLRAIERFQVENSDIISFHCYQNEKELETKILSLQQYGKPIFCTEYLARSIGSTFRTCLPILKKHRVAGFNWGLVEGKTQTIFPWDSWQKKYDAKPSVWHHDIFKLDGSPYDRDEIDFILQLTKKTN